MNVTKLSKFKQLESCFTHAYKTEKAFVVVMVEIEGQEGYEIIINPYINILEKLEYYRKTYDDDLNHKHAKGIKIVSWCSLDEIRELEINE